MPFLTFSSLEPDLVFQLVDNRALNSEVAGANPVEVINQPAY